jgi:hypothetical protein
MASFLDSEEPAFANLIIEDVKNVLFDNWLQSHFDEGEAHVDLQVALMTTSQEAKIKYNQFYNLNPGDTGYVNV